jgi:beta-1,4-N-acetylglucosaminyltransferase
MLAFLTVGSTKFDSLVQAALSEPVLDSLHRKGYTELIVQCGNSDFELAPSIREGAFNIVRNEVNIVLWKFKPSLQEEYNHAGIVISHAGMLFNLYWVANMETVQAPGLFWMYCDLGNR